MSTPFLGRFAHALIHALLDAELIDLGDADPALVIEHLSNDLAGVQTGSLITQVTRSLFACPGVEELWADDEQLKALVEDMGPGIARG